MKRISVLATCVALGACTQPNIQTTRDVDGANLFPSSICDPAPKLTYSETGKLLSISYPPVDPACGMIVSQYAPSGPSDSIVARMVKVLLGENAFTGPSTRSKSPTAATDDDDPVVIFMPLDPSKNQTDAPVSSPMEIAMDDSSEGMSKDEAPAEEKPSEEVTEPAMEEEMPASDDEPRDDAPVSDDEPVSDSEPGSDDAPISDDESGSDDEPRSDEEPESDDEPRSDDEDEPRGGDDEPESDDDEPRDDDDL